MSYYKILIVEDDPVIREQLRLLLAGSGYQAQAVADVPAAIRQMESFGPHLVVLDIGLPGASGLELCGQLLEINPRTNVVFLTSYLEYSFDAWNTGACGFLLKPISADARFCPYCGARVKQENRFCTQCGKSLIFS